MYFNVKWLDQVDSTNSQMRTAFLATTDYPSGSVIAAYEQTAGRGRQDRIWISAAKTNLYFSLFIKTDAPVNEVPSLTMATALAITESLTAHGIAAAPKWPNDILVNGKKICGILSERVMHAENAGIIVGVGLNVNMTREQADEIEQPATSMRIETGHALPLEGILQSLFEPMEHLILQWEQDGFDGIRNLWTEKAGPIGKPMTVRDGDDKIRGTLAGFGEHGELLLQTEHGIKPIWSGDVFE